MHPSTSDLQIRRWVFADIDAIREITIAAWREAYGAFIPAADLEAYYTGSFTRAMLEHAMASVRVHGYVALDDAGPAGWMRTLWDPATGRCTMTSLYVHPARQGRGAGSRLLEVAEHCARGHGAPELWLGVMERNTRVLEWYRRRGFAVRERLPFTMGKTTVQHCLCVKQLEGPDDER